MQRDKATCGLLIRSRYLILFRNPDSLAAHWWSTAHIDGCARFFLHGRMASPCWQPSTDGTIAGARAMPRGEVECKGAKSPYSSTSIRSLPGESQVPSYVAVVTAFERDPPCRRLSVPT